jgi:hypothetical protein
MLICSSDRRLGVSSDIKISTTLPIVGFWSIIHSVFLCVHKKTDVLKGSLFVIQYSNKKLHTHLSFDSCMFRSKYSHPQGYIKTNPKISGFGGLGLSALAFGTQVRGFKAVGFFRAKKFPARLSSEGK